MDELKSAPPSVRSDVRTFFWGFPIVVVVLLPLGIALSRLGVLHDERTDLIYTLVAIVTGVGALNVFGHHLQRPRPVVKVFAAAGYLLMLLILWARLSGRLPVRYEHSLRPPGVPASHAA